MTEIIGMQTDMDGAVGQWLEKHHVRAKDVYVWSATGQGDEMTTMTVSFYVSGVDEMPAPDAVDMADACPDSEPARPAARVDMADGTEVDVDEPATVVMTFDRPRPFIQDYLDSQHLGHRPRAIRDNPQG